MGSFSLCGQKYCWAAGAGGKVNIGRWNMNHLQENPVKKRAGPYSQCGAPNSILTNVDFGGQYWGKERASKGLR